MGRQVLLVEDEPLVAMEIQDIIEEIGLSADGPFASVAGACKALPDLDPCCAVLDVRLRDGEVFPLADQLAARGVPLIFHSGHMPRPEILKRYPAALFCEKPCLPRDLTQAIMKASGMVTHRPASAPSNMAGL